MQDDPMWVLRDYGQREMLIRDKGENAEEINRKRTCLISKVINFLK